MAISGAAVVLCRGLYCLLFLEVSSLFPQVLGHTDTITSLQADFTVRCSFIIYLFNVVPISQVLKLEVNSFAAAPRLWKYHLFFLP